MSEETANTMGGSATPSKSTPPHASAEHAGDAKELSELRKEVIETRNLIIKTDNLLKNLHAELKLTSRKQEQFEKRHLLTSATAFVIFAVLATVGAYSYARGEIHSVRQESSSNESVAKARTIEVEKLQKEAAVRRDASEKAQRIFELLSSGKEGPALNDAMVEATKIDRASLTPLEAKALEDKEASLKQGVATASHERGKAAFRRADFATAEKEFARYVELQPNGPDTPYAQFWLGESRTQLKKWAAAIAPLEAFMKGAPSTKNQDWASVLLGMAYEETGNWAKATEVYNSAIQRFPHSIHLTQIRNRLRRIPALQAAADGKKTAALPPKP